MIIDFNLQMSDAQAVTSSAASTNIIDLGADRDIGPGEEMKLVFTCDTTQAGTSPTVTFKLQTSATAGGTYTDLATSRTVAAMTSGQAVVMGLPDTNLQFIRAYFTIGGSSITAGAFSAQIVKDASQWQAYSDFE